MSAHAKTDRSKGGLLAACLAALVLIVILSVIGTRGRGVSCTSLPEVSAEPRDLPELVPPSTPPLTSPAEVPAVTTAATPEQLRGRVVDKHARMNVPWVTVEFRSGASSSRMTTNFDGAFKYDIPSGAGRIKIEVFDDEQSYGITDVDWNLLGDAKWVEIPIDIGPTFTVNRIGFGGVTAAEDWRLTLVQSVRPVGSAGEIEVRDEALEVAGEPDRVWSTVSLRFHEHGAFARWPRVEYEPEVALLPRMEVRSEPRCVRGAMGVDGTSGIQALGNVPVESFSVLSGRLKGDPEVLKSARVVVLPRNTGREASWTPDFREVEAPGGQFTVELRGKQTYSVIAWAAGCEPTIWMRNLSPRGRETLRDHRLKPLLPTAFVMKALPFMDEVDSNDLQAFLRARVQDTGTAARAVLFRAHVNEQLLNAQDLVPTVYRVDSIGIDGDPPARGETWTQVLPDMFAPQEALHPERARVHRFEWIDPILYTRRHDFALTAGPAGCIVTTKETPLNPSFTFVPDAPVYFTIWHGGSEPIAIVAKDFVERDGERVATFQPNPGWGVLIAFRVADSVERGKQPDGARRAGKGKSPTFTEMMTMPPLANVGVTSIQGGHGSSDEEGTLLVRSRMWPPRLSLRADGYRLRDLRRLPGPGSRWIALMEHDR